jgi:hypothetical protein
MSKETIQTAVDELSCLYDSRRELDGMLREEAATTFEQIEKINTRRQEDQDKIEFLRAQIEEAHLEISNDLEDVRQKITAKVKELKRACQGLSMKEAQVTTNFQSEDDKLKITVKRVSIITSYKAQALLTEMPDLRTICLDGDSLIQEVVNPDILERLITKGLVDADAVNKHRIQAKKTTAAVLIKEITDE